MCVYIYLLKITTVLVFPFKIIFEFDHLKLHNINYAKYSLKCWKKFNIKFKCFIEKTKLYLNTFFFLAQS